MNDMVIKIEASEELLILSLWSTEKYHIRSGSLLALYRNLKKMINLTYYLTMSFLMLKVWNTIPGSSM